MSDDDVGGAILSAVLVVIAMLCGTVIGCGMGCANTLKDMQQQAVKHGAATWDVAPDGSTTFRWKGEAEVSAK